MTPVIPSPRHRRQDARGVAHGHPRRTAEPRSLESPGEVSDRLPGLDRCRALRAAHRRGPARRRVSRRPRAEPARLGVRTGLRGPVRRRVPPRRHRRPGVDPRAQAARHRTVRRGVGAARHAGPPARNRHRRRQPLQRSPADGLPSHAPRSRSGAATPGGGHRRRPGRPRRRARSGPAALRRDDLRSRRRARRHDALRHSRIPAAAHPARGRNRPHRVTRRLVAAQRAAVGVVRAPAPARGGLRGRVPVGGRVARPRSADSGCGDGRRREGRRLPAQREPRLSPQSGPQGRGHRRRLRGLRRGSHGTARRP